MHLYHPTDAVIRPLYSKQIEVKLIDVITALHAELNTLRVRHQYSIDQNARLAARISDLTNQLESLDDETATVIDELDKEVIRLKTEIAVLTGCNQPQYADWLQDCRQQSPQPATDAPAAEQSPQPATDAPAVVLHGKADE